MAKTLGRVGQLIEGRPAKERATLKGREIAKIKKVARKNVKFSGADYDIEIVDMNPIEWGVEIFAKAWNPDGTQIGFGKDGSVEIERFRIFNPPIMVTDGTKTLFEVDGRDKLIDNTKEDVELAVLNSLVHTIKVKKEKFDDTNIVNGKIGNTTSTFYPDATHEDGVVSQQSAATTWSAIRDGAGTNADDSNSNTYGVSIICGAGTDTFIRIYRSILMFGTSSIPDTDDISSATLSVYGGGKSDDFSAAPDVNIYSSAPASDSSLAAGDYDSLGTTAFSSSISYSSFSTSAYNDFSLNASGIANISKTATSYFGARNASYDVADSPPTWQSNGFTTLDFLYRESASDPKLVVEHSDSTDYPINASETPSITEAFGRVIAVSPFLATESTTPTESLTKNFSITAFLQNEVVTITESISRGLALTVNLVESISITEILEAISAKVLVLSESVGLTDTLTRVAEYGKTLTEAVTITESLSARITEYAVSLAESVGLTELISVGIEISVSLSDSISITDIVATPLNWKRRDDVSTTWTPRTKPY